VSQFSKLLHSNIIAGDPGFQEIWKEPEGFE
jgi:hypothetical protein